MKRILITGATGNVGIEVIRFLFEQKTSNEIYAGVRNIDGAKSKLGEFSALNFTLFDFDDKSTYEKALKDMDTVFLLRPPHISDVKKYFNPLIKALKSNEVKEVVFLSVQGAEKSKVIPHNKIERLILDSNLNYIFLRPSYFMQNLTTTLLDDIQLNRQIILPAGKAKFNWIDVTDIGEFAAIMLKNFDEHKNQAFEITGSENKSFGKVVDMINEVVLDKIEYNNVNPFRFYSIKKKAGMSKGKIFVMILLHFLPRFQKEPEISENYKKITGKNPTTLKAFIKRNKDCFQ